MDVRSVLIKPFLLNSSERHFVKIYMDLWVFYRNTWITGLIITIMAGAVVVIETRGADQ